MEPTLIYVSYFDTCTSDSVLLSSLIYIIFLKHIGTRNKTILKSGRQVQFWGNLSLLTRRVTGASEVGKTGKWHGGHPHGLSVHSPESPE